MRSDGGGVGGGGVGRKGGIGRLGESWGVTHEVLVVVLVILRDERGHDEPAAVPSGRGPSAHGDCGEGRGEDGRKGEGIALLVLGLL